MARLNELSDAVATMAKIMVRASAVITGGLAVRSRNHSKCVGRIAWVMSASRRPRGKRCGLRSRTLCAATSGKGGRIEETGEVALGRQREGGSGGTGVFDDLDKLRVDRVGRGPAPALGVDRWPRVFASTARGRDVRPHPAQSRTEALPPPPYWICLGRPDRAGPHDPRRARQESGSFLEPSAACGWSTQTCQDAGAEAARGGGCGRGRMAGAWASAHGPASVVPGAGLNHMAIGNCEVETAL